jgi:hypothetical protein
MARDPFDLGADVGPVAAVSRTYRRTDRRPGR